MKNTQNATLVLLLITASVLTALLVASHLYSEPAYGAIASAKDGDYIMSTGAYNQESDFLYILDIGNNRLNIYYPNINTNSLNLGDSVDLAKVFGTAKP